MKLLIPPEPAAITLTREHLGYLRDIRALLVANELADLGLIDGIIADIEAQVRRDRNEGESDVQPVRL